MKKLLLLVLCLCAVLVGCNQNEDSNNDDNQNDDPNTVTVLTHAQYIAAEVDTEVTIEAYIQAKQSWWENKATLYLQDENGGYFVYELSCTKEQYDTDLANGNKIRVTGIKGSWEGEIEILGQQSGAEATWELVSTEKWMATATDVTSKIASADLVNYQNMLVKFAGLTVVGQTVKDEEGNVVIENAPFLYKWNGSGKAGDDVYIKFKDASGNEITCCIESYLCANGTAVYEAAEALKVGDKVTVEGFLYWYSGAQPHITSITPAN